MTTDLGTASTTKTPRFDNAAFRNVLGNFPTGVVLITAIADDGEPVGMILGSFFSVSLEPPMIGYLPTRTSSTFVRLRTARSFCVNVLAADQLDICRSFARKTQEDKFAGLDWTPSRSGAPIITGAVASIDCTLESITDAGDHYIVLCHVDDLRTHRATMPLLFFQGGYGRFTTHSLLGGWDAELIDASRAAEMARVELEGLATLLDAECVIAARDHHDVVVLAEAVGPNALPRAQLGTRTPLTPPLGEAFIAFSSEDDIAMWLARRSPSDAATELDYRVRLEATRTRGWSAAQAGPLRDREFVEAIARLGQHDLTPGQRREYESIVSQMSDDHAPLELGVGHRHRLAGIVVPILEGDASPRLAIRISQLRADADDRTVEAWAQAARATAARIAELIHVRVARR